ncbi:hypothetical protein C809_03658 [Lachnospiraceae bacterium MD335]|jgi:hypothetical protein|nr:hypothetical protein C809_03658 [Lachnospiraceae bacterium MD335]
MTAIRKEAIQLLEKVPEDKLSFVIQIIQGVNGLLGVSDTKEKEAVDLNQFVMESTERGQNADKYVRELRDDDRF